MSGTCKECLPIKAEGQDETYLYTYFNDVINRNEIRDLATQIQNTVQKSVANIKRYLTKWKKYKNLWKSEKVAICEKFFSKSPSVIAFDERILYYNKMIEEVNQSQKIKDIDFIRVSMRSLIESLANHSKEWMKCLGKLLNESAKQNLFDLKATLEVSSSEAFQKRYWKFLFIWFLF